MLLSPLSSITLEDLNLPPDLIIAFELLFPFNLLGPLVSYKSDLIPGINPLKL